MPPPLTAHCRARLAARLPGAAEAGAWPRPKGETFVSFGQQLSTGATTLLAATADIRSGARSTPSTA